MRSDARNPDKSKFGETAGFKRLETITVPRPRCPSCNGIRLAKYRSIRDQGDGTALWWVRCEACGRRFKVVLE